MANDDDDDFDADDFVDEEESGTAPRTSLLTLVLCVLNVAAAVGFTFLLVMNYQKRQAWSRAVLLHDLQIVGTNLRQEDAEGTSASRLTTPKPRLDPNHLKDAFSKRGGKSVNEAFKEFQDAFQYDLKAEYLTPEILKEIFDGEPVKNLEDEVERLQKTLLDDIAGAAKDYVAGLKAKDKPQKRLSLLFSLAHTSEQIETLFIREALADPIRGSVSLFGSPWPATTWPFQPPPPKLDDRLGDAVRRRMLVDILAPLDVHRPADLRERLLEKVADVDVVPLSDLEGLMKRRFQAALSDTYDPAIHLGDPWKDQKRDVVEKRKTIAYLLCAIAHVKKPTGDLLYPKQPERALAVVGVLEFAQAYQEFAKAHVLLKDRVLQAIGADREGQVFEVKIDPKDPNKIERVSHGGFVEKHRKEIQRLKEMAEALEREKKRHKDLQAQVTGLEVIIEERKTQVAQASKDYLKARKVTAKARSELQQLQRELFAKQKELAGAVQRNVALERLIRQAEGLKVGKKQ